MRKNASSPLARVLAAVLLACMLLFCMPALASGGSATTSLKSANKARQSNITIACENIDGWTVYSGETFSFNEAVGPRTADYGFQSATNGRGVKVIGGGVAQVATTLYLAAKDDPELKIGEFKTYGDRFTEGYCDPKDAIVTDYKAGTDFKFKNRGADKVIRAWVEGGLVHVRIAPVSQMDVSGTLIGSAQTWAGKSGDRLTNIKIAMTNVDGTVLFPGDEFSFNDTVGPRSKADGYKTAVNGRGVKVVGGGVAQVASTLYLAIKDNSDFPLLEKRTYGKNYNQDYVSSPDDAIVVDYSAGTDFRFRNDTGMAVTIFMEIDQYGYLQCCVSGEDAYASTTGGSTSGGATVFDDDFFLDDFDDDFDDDFSDLDGYWMLGDDGEWYWVG